MFAHLSEVSILTVALWLALELSIATGQATYRLTQYRPGRPMKLPQLRNGPECSLPYFPNGVAKPRQRNKMVRFTCAFGFQLVGNTYSMCEKGRWDTSIPICIRSGCPELAAVDNGQISYEHGQAAAMLFCSSGYQVAGATKTYCNGTHWDRPLGNCRETGIGVATSCDFETADLCGWMNEAFHDFDWKRSDGIVSPKALKTGPKFDHTTGTSLEGHFMMVDSVEQYTNETGRLLSPIYPANYSQNACFLFYYHMFGDGVGTLSVYVRPLSQQLDSVTLKDASFVLSGNQRNVWNEGYFDLKPLSEGFQIVIEASLGMKAKSDIAIDDVSLLNGEYCRPKADGEDVEVSSAVPDEPPQEVPVDDNIFKLGSCENRCGKNVSSVIAIPDSSVNFIQCDCFEGCVDSKTCCPDYAELCVFNDNSNVISTSSTASTTTSTTPRTRPTTTSSSTTSTTTVRTTSTTVRTTPKTVRTTPTTVRTTTTTKSTTTPKTTSTTTSTTTQRSTTTSTVRATTSTTTKPTSTSKLPTTTTTKIYNLRPRTTTTTSTARPPIIVPMIRTRKPTTKTTPTTPQTTTEEVQLKLVARFGDLPEDERSPSMLELGDTKPNLARAFLFSGLGVVSFGGVILLIVLHIRRSSGANVLNRLKHKSKKNQFGSAECFEDVRFLAADEHLDFSIPEDEAEEATEQSGGKDDAGERVEMKANKKSSKKGKK